MTQLTTKQVRAIIRKHNPEIGGVWNTMWTNKVGTGNVRSVKIYMADATDAMVADLRAQAGTKNVRITEGNQGFGGARERGLTVRCVLAN